LALSGPRSLPGWQPADTTVMDFYDLKGVVQGLLDGLNIGGARYEPHRHPSFHPGKCARLLAQDAGGGGERQIGVLGELHPQAAARYDLPASAAGRPILTAELDLAALYACTPERFTLASVPAFPPALEDLAMIVPEDLPGERVEAVIRQAGGRLVAKVRLFDVYRGGQIGAGMKSLAYSLTYQAPDHTLTDQEVAQARQKIIRRLEQELGARLRG
jgi:phenylalanyl-tRNA synthetase beta chain